MAKKPSENNKNSIKFGGNVYTPAEIMYAAADASLEGNVAERFFASETLENVAREEELKFLLMQEFVTIKKSISGDHMRIYIDSQTMNPSTKTHHLDIIKQAITDIGEQQRFDDNLSQNCVNVHIDEAPILRELFNNVLSLKSVEQGTSPRM